MVQAVATLAPKKRIHFVLNGQPVTVDADDERMLLWVLRTDLALTGTKYGCGEGLCGACTVSVGGHAVRSCLTPLKKVAGQEVVTIEGLARDGQLHPLQQAFVDHNALQCGYCTPGMLMEASVFLREHPKPSRQEIVTHMEHNLCRCGTQQRVVAAIESVAENMDGRS